MSRTIISVLSRNIRLSRLLIVISLALLLGLVYFSRAYGVELPERSLLVNSSITSATATYKLSFNIPSSETLGSIELQFCSNDPLISDPCTAPDGFDVSSATLSAQTGATDFTISSGTTANVLVLSRTPAVAAAGSVSYTLEGVTNPSAAGTYYGRLQTFASDDASGAENAHGGLAFSMNGAVSINATVPPYLLFCGGITISGYDCATATGDYANFGNFSASSASSVQSQLLAATNAKSGYGINVYGQTMTSGNNIINAMGNADVSRPGTSQFGLNLVANQTPSVGADPEGGGTAVVSNGYSQPNWYKFVPGDSIADVTHSDAYKKFTVSYVVNVPSSQTPGVYVATLTYVCLANF